MVTLFLSRKEVIDLNINLLKQANQEIQSRHANLPT